MNILKHIANIGAILTNSREPFPAEARPRREQNAEQLPLDADATIPAWGQELPEWKQAGRKFRKVAQYKDERLVK